MPYGYHQTRKTYGKEKLMVKNPIVNVTREMWDGQDRNGVDMLITQFKRLKWVNML